MGESAEESIAVESLVTSESETVEGDAVVEELTEPLIENTEEILMEEATEAVSEQIVETEITEEKGNGYLIAIDAGHQGKGNYDKEPVGPGAAETKAKVSSGTSGCVTGLAEYELNLILALKLQAELENRCFG